MALDRTKQALTRAMSERETEFAEWRQRVAAMCESGVAQSAVFEELDTARNEYFSRKQKDQEMQFHAAMLSRDIEQMKVQLRRHGINTEEWLEKEMEAQ